MLNFRITIRMNEKDFTKLREQAISNNLNASQFARILIKRGIEEEWKLNPKNSKDILGEKAKE